MEIVESEPEKGRAQVMYDKELARKMELDGVVKRLCRLSGSESILPVSEGYKFAKKTLEKNFGLPHVIAKAHLKKLEHLPLLKVSTGSTLLEFAKYLEIADRTLRGMGPEFVSDLNHTNTLMELNR